MAGNKYEVKLGINFDEAELKSVKNKINNLTDNTHRMRIDLDTSRIHKQFDHIEKRLKNLTGTKGTKSIKNAIPIDTANLERSLNDVASTIKEIKSSIGTLDGKGMKSLLSSINQISSALEKAGDQFEELNRNMNALSGKDLNLNFGITMGGSNPVARQTAYGNKARNETLPRLKEQMNALVKHYNERYEASLSKFEILAKMVRGSGLNEGDFFTNFLYGKNSVASRMSGGSLSSQMQAYKEYINMFKKLASLNPSLEKLNVDEVLSGFSKSADNLIQDAQDIQTGAKEMDESFEKLKQIFGGGNNLNVEGLSTQLDSIVVDLGEIKTALQGLSSGASLDGLTQSFDRLSETLEQVMANAKLVQSTLGNELVGVDGISNATQGLKDDTAILERFRHSLDNIGMGADEIDAVINRIKSLGIQIEALDQKKRHIAGQGKNGKDKDIVSVDISGIDKFGNAIQLTEKYNIATGELVDSLDHVSTVQQKAGASANTFAKQQKTAVSNLTNQINQLNRAAKDQNASRPIKDKGHLKALADKYDEITSAIQRMENASSDTFIDEQNNVRRLISEYKSLVSELRNAENVSTKMKGTDFKSGLNIAKNDLAKFKADAKDFPQITKTIKDLDEAIANVGDSSSLNNFNDQLRVARSELAKIKSETAAASRSEKVGIKVSGLTSQISELRKINPEIDKFEAEINGAKVTVRSLADELAKVKTQGDFSVVSAKFKAAAENVKLLEKISEKLEFNDKGISGFDAEISRIQEKYSKLSFTTNDLKNDMQALDGAFNEIKAANDAEELIAAYKKYEEILKRIENQLEINKNKERQVNNETNKASLELDRQKALLNLEKLFGEGSEAAKIFAADIDRIKKEIRECGNISGIRNLNKEIDNLALKAENANYKTQTFGQAFKKQWEQYKAYLSVASVFMYVEQGLRDMFEQVLAVDTAMTGLYRVTDLTTSQYTALYNDMIASAKEYGATLTDIINATSDWVRAGFDADTAVGLAEITTMYQHISDLDYDTAAENLLTAYNGFKNELTSLYDGDEVAAVEYIADIFNELDNNFAITSAGLGEAMTRSASALDLAGNTIQETAGMITGITEVTQDPEKAGNALKILSLRLRGMKGQLEELGEETDENVENISKMQGQILNMTGGKVNIFDASGDFKSTYEIMQGIANVWDDLSSVNQADLLETIAGKHRANDVAALLSNWENVEEAIKSAYKAEGSAATENAKYVDSLQGRLNKLTTSWQSFANTFMESDFLKSAISLLTEIVKIIEGLIKNVGTLGTIGLGAGIFGIVKNFNALKTLGKDVFAAFTTGAMTSIESFTKWRKASDGIVESGKGLGKSMSAVAGGIGLVIAAVGLAYNVYKNIKEKQAELRRETIDSSNTFLDSANSFEQAYIKYSGKADLTTEEEAELETAIQGTVDALGDKSSALQSVVDSSNDYVASLEQIAKEELKAANAAAKAKRDKAAIELEEAAIGWQSIDGSEVNIDFGLNMNEEAKQIAKEVGFDYFATKGVGKGQISKFGFKLDANADTSEILDYYGMLVEYQEKLSDADLGNTKAYEQVSAAIDKMSESVELYIDGLYDAVKAQYQLEKGIPTTVEEYLKMRKAILGSDDIKNTSFDTRKTIADTLDSEYSSVFDLSSAEAQARKFAGLIKGYGDGTKDGTNEIGTVETFLNMRTALNNNECTVGQYISEFDKVSAMTDEWSDKEEKEFNSTFGLDTDSIKEQYDKLYNYLSNKDISALNEYENTPEFRLEKDNIKESEIKDFLDGLSAYELEAAINLKTKLDWENDSWDEIETQIQEEAKLIEDISFDINIENVTEKLESLSTAMTESVSGSGLTTESISAIEDMFGDLAGYDPSKLFERTANGMRLNTTELNRLNSELRDTNVDGLEDKMSALGERYLQTREELSNLTYGTEEYNQKARELSDIEAQISATETLMAQYEGLTNAYQEWQRAESSGNQRDMYENVISGFETVKDELSRGWADDGTVEFLELITGKTELAGKSGKELKEIWKNLDDTIKHTTYSVKDFFTTDEEGNSTSKGVYNFLDAIGQMEEEKFGGKDVVKRKDGKIIGFDFQIVGGNEAIAEALGISEELVDIMVRAADDAGFVVSMDGTFQQLDVLKEKAQEAANELKNTFKLTDYEFNLDTTKATGKGSIAEQYEKASNIWEQFKKNKNADGTVNMNVEGAEEAYTLISTLQTMVDQLGEPVYMELDASQVEMDMRTPLSKLKEYETLTQQEHQLQLKGTDTSALEKDKDKIIDYFENLDEETKIELGIEELSREEIEAKIEKGEIEIPASVDIQMDMSDDIKDMKLLMMNELGLISYEEVRLKVGYEIDDSLVGTLNDDEKEVVINFISKNEEWFNNLSEEEKEVTVKLIAENKEWYEKLGDEEKEIVVDLVSSGVDIKTLTNDETKKIIVDFVTENDDIFDKLNDEEKQVFVKYVEENKEAWEKLSDDDKEILVELIASGVDLETLTNKEKKEVVIDFVTENDNEFNKLEDEEKQVVVDLVADGSALKALEEHGVEIEAFCNIFGVEKVDDLKKRLEGLDDEQILIVAEVLGKIKVDELKTAMNGLEDEDVKAIAEAIGKGDVESLRTAVFNLEDKEIKALAKAFGYESVDQLKNAMNNLTDKDVQAIAQTLGITDVDSLKAAIDRLSNKDVKAVANVDGTDDVKGLKGAIDNLKGKNITVWASIKKKTSSLWDKLTGGGGVDGTAHIDGTAFAKGTTNKTSKSGLAFKQGNWGTKDSGIALGGEEDPELLVRNGRWHLIGEKGAEFFGYKKGDIIFNASQTKEIFEKGKITHGNGRGKALVSGTAFSKGTGGGIEPVNKVTGQSYGKSNKDSDADKFEETIDWIPTAIDRIERAIDQLDTKASSVYRTWSERNSNLTSQISKVRSEITLQQKAYDKYIAAANAVGLSSSYAKKVREGTINIQTIKDETLAEKIKDYQEWYEKALDCKDAILELQEAESELYQQRFENVSKQYEGILSIVEHEKNMLEEFISQSEANAQLTSSKYYDALIKNEQTTISKLQSEKSALLSQLNTAVVSGKIKKESEAW